MFNRIIRWNSERVRETGGRGRGRRDGTSISFCLLNYDKIFFAFSRKWRGVKTVFRKNILNVHFDIGQLSKATLSEATLSNKITTLFRYNRIHYVPGQFAIINLLQMLFNSSSYSTWIFTQRAPIFCAERTNVNSIIQRKIIRDFKHFYKNNAYKREIIIIYIFAHFFKRLFIKTILQKIKLSLFLINPAVSLTNWIIASRYPGSFGLEIGVLCFARCNIAAFESACAITKPWS